MVVWSRTRMGWILSRTPGSALPRASQASDCIARRRFRSYTFRYEKLRTRSQKLVLHKETLRLLEPRDLSPVRGAASETVCDCPATIETVCFRTATNCRQTC